MPGISRREQFPWRQPLYYFQMPPALFNALKDDDKSVVVSLKTAYLKFTDGTEQNY